MQYAGHCQQHPFAVLNELQQSGVLDVVLYEDCGCEQSLWKARVEVRGNSLGTQSLSADGQGGSKKHAKRRAASALLAQIRAASPALPPPPPPAFPATTYVPDGKLEDRCTTSARLRPAADEDTFALSKRSDVHSVDFCCFSDHDQSTAELLMTRKQRSILQRSDKHLALLRRLSSDLAPAQTRDAVLLAVDVEWHESGDGEILEVGISWIPLSQICMSPLPLTTCHLVVEDFYTIRNGKFVADNKDRFAFGTSELVVYDRLSDRISERLTEDLATFKSIYLFGHSLQHDKRILRNFGLPHALALRVTGVCDIAMAYSAKCRRFQPMKLLTMLTHYDIEHDALHNAGNDACYTLQCAIKMLLRERVVE